LPEFLWQSFSFGENEKLSLFFSKKFLYLHFEKVYKKFQATLARLE